MDSSTETFDFAEIWAVPGLLQTVNPVIIKNKKYKKNTTPNYKKIQHWAGQNYQQKENTTYIDGFAVLFFDGMSKKRKKYKRIPVEISPMGSDPPLYRHRMGGIEKSLQNGWAPRICLDTKW